jgi:NAD(P)H-dependent flavin oxidoreductase YrpB (nitropropane dioxygenase family)
MQLSCKGEPVYGIRDHADLQKIRSLGLPFWLAGSYGAPGKLEEALHLGASGIQVGTAFAFCEESGITPELKRLVLEKVREGTIEVFTDPAASPTGFPFKVVRAGDSNLDQRERRTCDLGVLREAYLRQDQSIGYRCPSEPLQDYVRKGGNVGNTTGRKCVCNGLLATIGLGQSLSNGQLEPPLITAGDSLADIAPYLLRKSLNYNAADVIRMLSESSPVKNERLLLHS